MGKFDDFKKTDQFSQAEEDIYGATSPTAHGTAKSNSRLEHRVRGQKVETPTYEKVVEIDKTMDLKFIKGVLHQKIIERSYTLEVMSGESKLDSSLEKWIPVPFEMS